MLYFLENCEFICNCHIARPLVRAMLPTTVTKIFVKRKPHLLVACPSFTCRPVSYCTRRFVKQNFCETQTAPTCHLSPFTCKPVSYHSSRFVKQAPDHLGRQFLTTASTFPHSSKNSSAEHIHAFLYISLCEWVWVRHCVIVCVCVCVVCLCERVCLWWWDMPEEWVCVWVCKCVCLSMCVSVCVCLCESVCVFCLCEWVSECVCDDEPCW